MLYSEIRRINIHNQRDRQKGRSVQGQGEIFRYDALDVGQTFQAVILCEEAEAQILQNLLKPEDIWLGGSQSAGYGHIKISEVQPLDSWNEVGIEPNKRDNRQSLIVTLLSGTLLRNQLGQPVADPLLVKQAIEETLNVKLPPPKLGGIYASSTLIGGFNRKWGLPLPQVPALAAGSVIVFDDFQLTSAQIQQLETQGIGERRVEGFGRVAVNWSEEPELKAKLPNPASTSTQLPISEASRSLAALMAERLLRQRLDRLLVKEVGRIKLDPNSDYISNSQLSRLGIVARQALRAGGFTPVRELLNPENLTKNALSQFQGTKLENRGSLYDQLHTWLNEPNSWISNPQDLEVTITPTVKQGLDDNLGNQLVIEYTLRLIMAVAKKATKEKI